MTFQKPQTNKSSKIRVGPEGSVAEDWRKRHPSFSLQYTVPGYCVADCDQAQKAAFASTLHQLGKRTWIEIQQSNKHGSGSEKLPRYRMKVAIPGHINEDQEFFTVVRFCGMSPMIGYVNQGVYYIVWLDRNHDCY